MIIKDGKVSLLEGGVPVITSPAPGNLHITWPLKSISSSLVIDIDERQVKMKVDGQKPINWFLDMTTADNMKLPFQRINPSRIECQFEGMNYSITATKGLFSKPDENVVFRITPVKNNLILNLSSTTFTNQKAM